MRVRCPVCGRVEDLKPDEETVRRASSSPSGVTAVVINHGDHAMIAYVDPDGKVRSVESARVSEVGGDLMARIREVPVPGGGRPDISALSEQEWRFLALCDGERTIREIAALLGIPVGRARIMAERLRAGGYLKEVRVGV